MKLDFPGIVCPCGCPDSDHFYKCGGLWCKKCSLVNSVVDDTPRNFSIRPVPVYYKGFRYLCAMVIEN